MIEQTSWFQLQPLYRYIRQQSENRRFFKYIEIGSTFFLIAIFLFFAIMPTASAISALIGEIKSKETLSAAMSSKISNTMAAQDSFSQIQGDYSVLESSYPVLPNFYTSTQIFSSISRQSSTPIKQISIRLSDNPEKGSHNTFSINTNTLGSYSSFLSFIDGLSITQRLIDIKSIQISRNDQEGSSLGGQLNLNLNADLYYLPKNNNDQK